VLDWFHVGMRFENLKQVAKGIDGLTNGALRNHALSEIERAKWRFWNGYAERGIIALVHLAHWAAAQCFHHLPSLNKLSKSLLDGIRYLESNSDSMPDYGERYRVGARISTGFAESAVNEIIGSSQGAWRRNTADEVESLRGPASGGQNDEHG
jgi:hypothetical protein